MPSTAAALALVVFEPVLVTWFVIADVALRRRPPNRLVKRRANGWHHRLASGRFAHAVVSLLPPTLARMWHATNRAATPGTIALP